MLFLLHLNLEVIKRLKTVPQEGKISAPIQTIQETGELVDLLFLLCNKEWDFCYVETFGN